MLWETCKKPIDVVNGIMKRRSKILPIVIIVSIILISVALALLICRYRFESHYFEIMKNLNKPSTQEAIRNNMTYSYNFTELFEWEHSYLKWVPMDEDFDRSNDPVEILANGKGRCGEFSILYLSACLSLGYEARLLASVRPYNYSGLHNWVEVKVNDSWIHVDPTDRIWNDPSRYKSWWGEIGKDALIYAFEDGKVEEVTDRYRSGS